MKLYNRVDNEELELSELQLSDFYKPSVQQKQGEMICVRGMALALGVVLCGSVEGLPVVSCEL